MTRIETGGQIIEAVNEARSVRGSSRTLPPVAADWVCLPAPVFTIP
ncbi:hypothetical protein [Haloferula helveola]